MIETIEEFFDNVIDALIEFEKREGYEPTHLAVPPHWEIWANTITKSIALEINGDYIVNFLYQRLGVEVDPTLPDDTFSFLSIAQSEGMSHEALLDGEWRCIYCAQINRGLRCIHCGASRPERMVA